MKLTVSVWFSYVCLLTVRTLDAVFFSPYKSSLKVITDGLLPSIGETSIDKQTELGLAILKWNGCRLGTNLSAGLCTCGIFPLSRVNDHAKHVNVEQNGYLIV